MEGKQKVRLQALSRGGALSANEKAEEEDCHPSASSAERSDPPR
jgi:hypothetical protein